MTPADKALLELVSERIKENFALIDHLGAVLQNELVRFAAVQDALRAEREKLRAKLEADCSSAARQTAEREFQNLEAGASRRQ